MESTNEVFCCPISGALMKDPVIAPDGHSYDRHSIIQWLANKAESPITRQPMTAQDLKPNRAL